MAYRHWTPEEDTRLISLLESKISVREICLLMGRTKASIDNRSLKLLHAGRIASRKKPQTFICVVCKKRPTIVEANGTRRKMCKPCRNEHEYERRHSDKAKDAYRKNFFKKHGRYPTLYVSHAGHRHKSITEQQKCRKLQLAER